MTDADREDDGSAPEYAVVDALAVRPGRTRPWYLKKQLDYMHQMRSAGGEARRKLRATLPPIERQRYRRALDAVTRTAARDEETALTASDTLRGTKRAHFTLVWPRGGAVRLLVTGAGGFVGGPVCRLAADQPGWTVHAASRRPADLPAGVAQHCLDLLDPAATARLLATLRPAAIVHLAGQSSVGRSLAEPAATLRR
jgi:hypothetical protein